MCWHSNTVVTWPVEKGERVRLYIDMVVMVVVMQCCVGCDFNVHNHGEVERGTIGTITLYSYIRFLI